jgi:hypothetical protein
MAKATRVFTGTMLVVSSIACDDDGGAGDDEVGTGTVPPEYNGVRVHCVGSGQQWAGWHPVLDK